MLTALPTSGLGIPDSILAVPVLAVLSLIVGLFLKHIRDSDRENRAFLAEQQKRFTAAIDAMARESRQTAAECHAVQMKSIESNSRTIDLLSRIENLLLRLVKQETRST